LLFKAGGTRTAAVAHCRHSRLDLLNHRLRHLGSAAPFGEQHEDEALIARCSWPARYSFWEDRFNIALRKFLKVVGITSQREIERVVREGKVDGTELKLRMTQTAENAPLNHVVEETIDLR
jgi:hypothetical protein